MNDEVKRLLVTVLAASDAVFKPRRGDDHKSRIVFRERMDLFTAAGVPWNSTRFLPEAGSDATRQAISRLLREMNASDLVETSSPSGTRTTALKLTARGDRIARSLIGSDEGNTAAMDVARAMLQKLVDFCNDSPDAAQHGLAWWAPETFLAGCKWGDADQGPKLTNVEYALLPALTLRRVVSNSDAHRHVWYHACRVDLPPVEALPAWADLDDDRWVDLYFDTLHDSINAIQSAKPKDDNRVVIPMSCSPTLRRFNVPGGGK